MKRQTSLYFIVIGAFLIFISGNFFSEGISRIGLDNALVSQRMSEGFEDFWLPSLDTPGNPDRQNYLPLGYWIESQWYSLFGGSSFLTDKLFSLMTFIVIALLMIWIWTLLGNTKKTGWLPLMCWISIPIVSWSATNNLLESVMTVFTALSMVFLMKGRNLTLIANSREAAGGRMFGHRLGRVAWTVLAALMMEMAFMVKGITGLFPFFFPILYWFFVKREKVRMPIISMAVIIATWAATLLIVIIASPEIYDHLYLYIHRQLIGGVLHVRTVASHFYILYVLVIQMAIPLFLLALICLIRIKQRPFYRIIFFWRNKDKLTADQKRNAQVGWLFISVGVSGILPIMLGLKQQDFYIVPTLPFFAIGVGCLILSMIDDWLEHIGPVASRVLVALAILLFSAGVLLSLNSIQKVSNDKEMLADVRQILPMLDEGECISVSDEVMQTPELEEYMYRYKKIVFDTALNHPHLLSLYSNLSHMNVQADYQEIPLSTDMYKLYEIIDHAQDIDTNEVSELPLSEGADSVDAVAEPAASLVF